MIANILNLAALNTCYNPLAKLQGEKQAAAAFTIGESQKVILARKQVNKAQLVEAGYSDSYFANYLETTADFAFAMVNYRAEADKAARQVVEAVKKYDLNDIQAAADKAEAEAITRGNKAESLNKAAKVAAEAAEVAEKIAATSKQKAEAADKAAAKAKVESEAADKKAAEAAKVESEAAKVAEYLSEKKAEAAAAGKSAEAAEAEAKKALTAEQKAVFATAEKAKKAIDKAAAKAKAKVEAEKKAEAAKAEADKAEKKAEAAKAEADKAAKAAKEFCNSLNEAEKAAQNRAKARREAEAAAKVYKAKATAENESAAILAKAAFERAEKDFSAALENLPEYKAAAAVEADFPCLKISEATENALVKSAKNLLLLIGFSKEKTLSLLFEADKPKDKRPSQSESAKAIFALFAPFVFEVTSDGKAQKTVLSTVKIDSKGTRQLKADKRAAFERFVSELYKAENDCILNSENAIQKAAEAAENRKAVNNERKELKAAEAAAEAAKVKILANIA